MLKALCTPLAGLSLLIFAASATLAEDQSAASKTVWDGHLQKAMAGDLDAVMTDFTDQSAIITADRVYAGSVEVRQFLAGVIKGFTPEVVESIAMQAETARDRLVFTELTIGAAKRTFVYTALVEGGKIMTITEADFPAE